MEDVYKIILYNKFRRQAYMNIANLTEHNIGLFCKLSKQMSDIGEARNKGKEYFEKFSEEERQTQQELYDRLNKDLDAQEQQILKKLSKLKKKSETPKKSSLIV